MKILLYNINLKCLLMILNAYLGSILETLIYQNKRYIHTDIWGLSSDLYTLKILSFLMY